MPQMKISNQYYTAAEVKERLGITQGMLYNYVRNGSLKPMTPPGKKQSVYLRIEVDRLARETQAFMAVRSRTSSTFTHVTGKDVKDLKASVELTRILFGLRESEETTFERRLSWVKKNPEIIYVLKSEEQIFGYAIMLPLQKAKIEDILNGKKYSQEINAEEIEEFMPGKPLNIYLMGIGVTPGLSLAEKRIYGARLIAGMMGVIVDLGKRGIVIDTLFARSDTPDGIRLLKQGFTEVQSATHARNFLIKIEESGIPMIQEYKEALMKHWQEDNE